MWRIESKNKEKGLCMSIRAMLLFRAPPGIEPGPKTFHILVLLYCGSEKMAPDSVYLHGEGHFHLFQFAALKYRISLYCGFRKAMA